MDLYFSGTSDLKSDDTEKKICTCLSVQFSGWICIQCLLDVNEAWINIRPKTIPLRVLYFVISYLLICIGIALSNRCGLPIIPTDLFPRELSEIIKVKYSKVKVSFDVICLTITACMTGLILGHISGLGIGTVLAAFTMGKVIGLIGDQMDKHFWFVDFAQHRSQAA